jgi:V8-like Glu-specific endopeptidase
MLDVIGYPGNYDLILINRLHGTDVSDVSAAYAEAKAILPKWKLTVTCGNIISTGDNLLYDLSTIGGMSGGPVVYKGNVIGASFLRRGANIL